MKFSIGDKVVAWYGINKIIGFVFNIEGESILIDSEGSAFQVNRRCVRKLVKKKALRIWISKLSVVEMLKTEANDYYLLASFKPNGHDCDMVEFVQVRKKK